MGCGGRRSGQNPELNTGPCSLQRRHSKQRTRGLETACTLGSIHKSQGSFPVTQVLCQAPLSCWHSPLSSSSVSSASSEIDPIVHVPLVPSCHALLSIPIPVAVEPSESEFLEPDQGPKENTWVEAEGGL